VFINNAFCHATNYLTEYLNSIRTWSFNIATTVRHLIRSWDNSMHCTLPKYISLQSILILSSQTERILKMVVFCPDDGDSKELWNVDKLLPDYTALRPRRQPSSFSPQWQPQILERILLPCPYLQISIYCKVDIMMTFVVCLRFVLDFRRQAWWTGNHPLVFFYLNK
jgi:hypothetical protein